jgi:hypothetical protein
MGGEPLKDADIHAPALRGGLPGRSTAGSGFDPLAIRPADLD